MKRVVGRGMLAAGGAAGGGRGSSAVQRPANRSGPYNSPGKKFT